MSGTIQRTGGSGGTQQISQTQDVQQTTGTDKSQGVSTTPSLVSQQQTSSIPQNDPPKISQQEMIERFDGIMKQLSTGKDLDVASIMRAIEELQFAIDSQQVETQKVGLKGVAKQIQDNVETQVKKLTEAKEKMEAEKTWNTVKEIFTWAAVVIGVVASVATGGALSICLAGLGAALTIAQKTGAMDKAFDALGIKDQGWRTAINIGLSLLLIAGNFANIAMIAKGTGDAVTGLLSKVIASLKDPETAKWIGACIKQIAALGDSGAKAGEGFAQIGGSVARKEGDDLNIQVKESQTQNLRLKQQQQDMIEMLKDLLKLLDDGVQGTLQVQQTQSQTTQKLIQRMS
jgi:hypothetical protein